MALSFNGSTALTWLSASNGSASRRNIVVDAIDAGLKAGTCEQDSHGSVGSVITGDRRLDDAMPLTPAVAAARAASGGSV